MSNVWARAAVAFFAAPAETSAGAGIHVPDVDRDWRWLIAHNTLVNNTGNTPYVTNVSVPTGATVVNCIIRGACDPQAPDGHDDKDLLLTIARNCNIELCPDKATVTAAPWNFGDDPVFLGTGDDPYYITLNSPCVNAGTNTNPATKADILNVLRKAAPDIGAYECNATTLSDYVYITGPSEATEGDAVTLAANLNPNLDPAPVDVNYLWKLNGVNVGTDSDSYEMNPVQHTDEGVYTVTATYNGTPVVSNEFTLSILGEDEAEEDEEGLEGPAIEVDPFMLVLDNAPIDGSVDGVFTVRNTGNETLEGQAVVQSGPFTIHFIETATYVLQPGETTEVAVRFTPPNEGQFPGSIKFTGRGIDSVTRNLLGSTGPVDTTSDSLNVYPNILQFGYTAVNSVKDLTITLQNPTDALITGTVIAPTPFSVPTSADYSIAPQTSATVTIRFQPQTPSNFSGVITFSTSYLTVAVHGTSLQAVPATSLVILNEVLPWNTNGLRSADSTYPDWIELHNANQFAVDIAGWGLRTQPGSQTNDYTFPSTVIAPNGYLIAFATTSAAPPGELHTGFELNETTGGYLGLSNPGGSVASSVEFPATSQPGWSYSFFSDSGGNRSWNFSRPPTPYDTNGRWVGEALVVRCTKPCHWYDLVCQIQEAALRPSLARTLLPKIVQSFPRIGYKTEFMDSPKYREFLTKLNELPDCKVFAYTGHGGPQFLVRSDQDGDMVGHAIPPEDINNIVAGQGRSLDFVYLLACSTDDDFATPSDPNPINYMQAFNATTYFGVQSPDQPAPLLKVLHMELWDPEFWWYMFTGHTVEDAIWFADLEVVLWMRLWYGKNPSPGWVLGGKRDLKLSD